MKIILLTGASSGIGLEAARIFANKGDKVYGAARRVELIAAENNPNIIPIRLDVTDEENIKSVVEEIIAKEGRIDVLVNNAGYGSFGPIETVEDKEARRQVEVNVFGLASLAKHVMPHMRKQGSGTIVNVGSVAGRVSLYFGGWYHVTKFAVEALSDALRMEGKEFGIKTALIEPGGIKTDWGIIAGEHLAEAVKGTVYEEKGSRAANYLKKAYSMNVLTKPKTVAKTIVKASYAKHPKARYHVGSGSRFMIFAHAILPNKWWDFLVKKFMTIKM